WPPPWCENRPTTALSGYAFRHDKFPTSTTPEGVPCASRRLNNRFGRWASSWRLHMRGSSLSLDRQAAYFQLTHASAHALAMLAPLPGVPATLTPTSRLNPLHRAQVCLALPCGSSSVVQ